MSNEKCNDGKGCEWCDETKHDEWVSGLEFEYKLRKDQAVRKFDEDWEAGIYQMTDGDKKKSSMLSLPGWKDYVIAFFLNLFGVIAVYILLAGSYDHE